MKTKYNISIFICGILSTIFTGYSQNILSNGDFSQTTEIISFFNTQPPANIWSTSQDSDVNAKATIVNGICNYEIISSGNFTFAVQLAQGGFPLKLGHSYKLSFDVKADSNRFFGVFLGENGGNWTSLIGANNYNQNATTEWRNISIEFDVFTVFPYHKLSFELGTINSSIFFDNVILNDLGVKKKTVENYPLPISGDYTKVESWKRFDKEFGNLYDYYLKEPKTIKSIPCKGRFTVDDSGELYGFVLSEDFKFHGNMIPEGSRYEGRVHNNRRNGYMIYLSRDSEIQGLMVRSKGKGWEDYKLDFYHNNKLRGFKLVNDTEINGIPCKGGENDYVILYPDGNIGECTLSSDFVSSNDLFLANTRIMISKDGKVFKKKNSPIKIDFYMDIENL